MLFMMSPGIFLFLALFHLAIDWIGLIKDCFMMSSYNSSFMALSHIGSTWKVHQLNMKSIMYIYTSIRTWKNTKNACK